MKKFRVIMYGGVILLLLSAGCKKKENPAIVPDDMKISVSDAISFPDLDKKKSLELADSILSGKDLYQQLRALVYLGDFSAGMVQGALDFIKTQDITKPVSFTYISQDDQQEKTLTVTDHYLFLKQTWDYGLVITDVKLGKAFLMVWNLSPLKAIAILHPVAFNNAIGYQRKAYIKVEYGKDNPKYDRTMIVSATGLDSTDVRYVKRMKVFFGQKGNVVYLYGNFNMPYAYVINPDERRGRSWSFKAKNDIKLDIAIARCGLPLLSVNTVDDIWSYYSMDEVLKQQIMSFYPDLGAIIVDNYIKNAKGVAYFEGKQGFVSNDQDNPDPTKFTSTFIDMSSIDPWPPASVESISINF